jgi:hypothetical protein
MTARFFIRGTTHLPSSRLLVVQGEAIDGVVAAGQLVWNIASIDQPLHSVESMLLDPNSGQSTVALCFRYRDDAELQGWQSAIIGEEVLELRDPTAVMWSDGKKRNPPTRPGEYPRASE